MTRKLLPIDLSKCKSDAEKLLGRALNEIPDEVWATDWTVEQQAKISVSQAFGDERHVGYDLSVDFLFECVPTEEYPLRPYMRIAVKVDNRAVHDLNPEQIEKDRWRDRKLANLGTFVLSYSASHIIRNPEAVADEIFSTLEGLFVCLDPVRWLVDRHSPDKDLEWYKDIVNARLRKMIARTKKYADSHPDTSD
ncbi:MAG: hypothetical protein ACE5JQ_05720 [Candidatus Methylomirabilales bacterium]